MATKRYYVSLEFTAQYNVQIEAESKKEAEVFARKNINFNLGKLEENDTLEGGESTRTQAQIIKG